ncbi:type VI secretion system ATPase TssH, partial [Burkholderia sp. Bp9143]
LIEAGDGDIPAILRHYGIDIDKVWDGLIAAIAHVPRNLRGKPALSPQLATVMQDAWARTASDTEDATVRSGNLLQAIVDAPHVLRAQNAWPLLSISSAQIERLLPRLAHRSCENAPEEPDAEVIESASAAQSEAPAATPAAPETRVAQHKTDADALARFAIDLTDKARNGQIDPVFGRDREIQQMVDVLAR